jgi:hypothetical protein
MGDVLAAKDGVEGKDWVIYKASGTYQQINKDGYIHLKTKLYQALSQKLKLNYAPCYEEKD